MSLVLLVSNTQYLLSNSLYELGIQQWLGWVTRAAGFPICAVSGAVVTHSSHEVAVHSRAPQPLTTWSPPQHYSSQGKGSKREGKRKKCLGQKD